MLRLVSAGGGIEEFQWSSSEQVWPFEKAADGSTLYCKKIDGGAMPNTGSKFVEHNLGDPTKVYVHRLQGMIRSVTESGKYQYALPNDWGNLTIMDEYVQFWMANNNMSDYNGFANIIYKKEI